MTNDKMFEEVGCPEELKKCKQETKRHKRHIEKLSNQLLDYERIIEERDNEIIIIKNKWKGKDDWDIFTSTKGTTNDNFIFCSLCYLEIY